MAIPIESEVLGRVRKFVRDRAPTLESRTRDQIAAICQGKGWNTEIIAALCDRLEQVEKQGGR